jgi:transposase
MFLLETFGENVAPLMIALVCGAKMVLLKKYFETCSGWPMSTVKSTGSADPLTDLFPPGKGGGDDVDYGYKGKGTLTHLLVEGDGMPLAASTTSAKGDEREEVAKLLGSAKVPNPKGGRPKSCPAEVQADKGYDSKEVRKKIRNKGAKPIIPYRVYKNRMKRPGKKPPELVDRFKVERCFAWLDLKFRRLSSKWERRKQYWKAFLFLGMSWMWLQRLLKLPAIAG